MTASFLLDTLKYDEKLPAIQEIKNPITENVANSRTARLRLLAVKKSS